MIEGLSEAVDEFCDGIEPDELIDAAKQLGITTDVLLDNIVTELKARISGYTE